MIDWHSHILPNMDDGSKSIKESLCLLKMLAEQDVDIVVATPHFYANDESVEEFLKRREASCRALHGNLSESAPKILLGAEVRYYPGISRLSGLKQLRIENTNLLLLEMSMSKWSESIVSELTELASRSDLTVILAHVERYLPLQSADAIERLLESGILMQVNASGFTEFGSRRKTLNLLNSGIVHFIGSDTHNTVSRPPEIKKAFAIIQKKFGDSFINEMNEYGYSQLVQNN